MQTQHKLRLNPELLRSGCSGKQNSFSSTSDLLLENEHLPCNPKNKKKQFQLVQL